jgi:signal transduction histidine kinase
MNQVRELFPNKLALISLIVILFVNASLIYSNYSNFNALEKSNSVDIPSLTVSSSILRIIGEAETLIEYKTYDANLIDQKLDIINYSITEMESLLVLSLSNSTDLKKAIDEIKIQVENLHIQNTDFKKIEKSQFNQLKEKTQVFIESFLFKKAQEQERQKQLSIFLTFASFVGIIIFLFILWIVYRRYQKNLITLEVVSQKLETERVNSMQSAKLASLGEMAAGLAHEINNPLAVIIGRTDLILGKLTNGEVEYKDILSTFAKINQMGNRISTIVTSMRRLAKGVDISGYSVCVDARDVVNDIVNLSTERMRNAEIQLVLENLDLEVKVKGDFSLISQILINLVNNAIDELKEHQNEEEKNIKISASNDSQWVYIKVQDNGRGIAKENRQKIFEPFFTTKEVGKGTGLGLGICINIAREMGGDVYLEEQIRPTVFVVKLPHFVA